MLKKRIIPIQLLSRGRLVKSVKFGHFRDVGDPVSSSKVYNAQDADELVFLNIDRDRRSAEPLLEILEQISRVSFMPMAVGGGINSFEDADRLIRRGADKVVVNSLAYRQPEVIARIADRYGSQAVVVSVDAQWVAHEKDFFLYANCGRELMTMKLESHIAQITKWGAGEILINSIDKDGTMSGYDINLLRRTVLSTNIPVIGCGGAGNYEHMREAFADTGVSALACGSLFNFGDNNPIRAKAFLKNYGVALKVI